MSAALLENFDLLAASVGGVARLRELILSLAVRGRLVPQDPNDEPASELLKRIRAEKDRLIKEGKVKRDKALGEIAEDELPYELPTSWRWARFGDLFSLEYGDNLPAEKRSGSGEFPVYGSNGIVGTHHSSSVSAPCIVVGRKGSAGALNLSLTRGCWVTDVAYYCVPPAQLDLLYVFKLLHTLGLDDLGKGIKPGLNRNEAYLLPVGIPPLAEQSRIVAKVEELMALCDRLEAEQSHAALVQGHWVDAALDQLAESADADEFHRHWQLLAAHFDTLFTTPESIDRLDATLLQLAVRGKLVLQDPNDEPASELLKQIRAEKDRLIEEGKIKRDKPLPPVRDGEKSYLLPEGWQWVTIPELCQIGGGATPSKNIGRYWDGAIPWVSPKDMKVALIADAIDHVSPAALEETRLPLVPQNSILVVVRGMILAHSFPVGVTQTEVTINQDMKSLTPYAESLSSYLALTMRGFKSDILALVDRSTHGTCKLASEKLFSYRFALPPLAEQSRIVAQVEKLQSLTAILKTRLIAAQTKQAHLAEALIAEVV